MANEIHVAVKVNDQATKVVKAIGSALVGLVGGAVIPATGAVLALGVELAGAGAALGVFGAAVAPQVAVLKDANTAQDAYNKAVTEYGKGSTQAATALKKYHGELAAMNPAQKAAFTSFSSLKTAFGAWSNSLSSSTLPVFTHAMNGLKNLLPLLSPLVRAVAKELGGLSTRFEAFSKTQKFKDLVRQFSGFAAGALHNVISGIEKLAKLVAGWVGGAGFQNFIRTGAKEGPGLATALKNIAQAVGRFIAAAGPLAGLQLKVFESMAAALNAIPQPVLNVLVPTLLGIAAAIKILALAEMVWNGVLMVTDALLTASGWTLIVAGILALIAVIVLIATKTKWFQTIWRVAWGAMKTAFSATLNFIKGLWNRTWNAMKTAWAAIMSFFRSGWGRWIAILTPVGYILFIIANWKKLKAAVSSAISGIIGWVKKLIGWIKNIVGKTIQLHQKGAEAIIRLVQSIINWIKKFVGKSVSVGIRGAAAAVRAVQGVINTIKNLVGKTVHIGVSLIKSGASKLWHAIGFAHGGVVGAQAAGGGPRSNQVMVGEQGAEIVDLPTGSRVRSNADSRRILGQGGGGDMQPFVLQVVLGDSKTVDLLIDPLRKAVQKRGGVQAALGKI
jgi:phage-related protein